MKQFKPVKVLVKIKCGHMMFVTHKIVIQNIWSYLIQTLFIKRVAVVSP